MNFKRLQTEQFEIKVVGKARVKNKPILISLIKCS